MRHRGDRTSAGAPRAPRRHVAVLLIALVTAVGCRTGGGSRAQPPAAVETEDGGARGPTSEVVPTPVSASTSCAEPFDRSSCPPVREVCNGWDDDGDTRTDGGMWCSVTSPYFVVYDAVVLDDGFGWAVGPIGSMLAFDGVTWRRMAAPPGWHMQAVWGLDRQRAWAVGEGGRVLRWNGCSWSDDRPPDDLSLLDLWGTAEDDVWAVGSGETAIRWDGSAWSRVRADTEHGPTPAVPGLPSPGDLTGVWMDSQGAGWMVGWGPSLLRRR